MLASVDWNLVFNSFVELLDGPMCTRLICTEASSSADETEPLSFTIVKMSGSEVYERSQQIPVVARAEAKYLKFCLKTTTKRDNTT
jgi:hypothetical protein